MNILSLGKKKLLIVGLLSLILMAALATPSLAKKPLGKEDIPEVKFTPEIIKQYEDEEGNLVTEYSELPSEYITDADGNIIAEGPFTEGAITEGISSEDTISLMSACTRQYYYKDLYTITVKTNGFISNHPGFTKWDKVDGYWFGTSSVSYSVGLSGYGGVSVSVSVAGPGYGTFIKADSSRWSRPGIYGNVNKVNQQVTMIDPCGPDSTYYRDVYRSNSTYNKTIYQ